MHIISFVSWLYFWWTSMNMFCVRSLLTDCVLSFTAIPFNCSWMWTILWYTRWKEPQSLFLQKRRNFFVFWDTRYLPIPSTYTFIIPLLILGQIVVHQMFTVCEVAKKDSWTVLQSFTRPLLSSTLAKSGGNYLEACNILLQSPDAHKWAKFMLC